MVGGPRMPVARHQRHSRLRGRPRATPTHATPRAANRSSPIDRSGGRPVDHDHDARAGGVRGASRGVIDHVTSRPRLGRRSGSRLRAPRARRTAAPAAAARETPPPSRPRARRAQAVEHLERPRPNVVPRQRQRPAPHAGAAPPGEQRQQLIGRNEPPLTAPERSDGWSSGAGGPIARRDPCKCTATRLGGRVRPSAPQVHGPRRASARTRTAQVHEPLRAIARSDVSTFRAASSPTARNDACNCTSSRAQAPPAANGNGPRDESVTRPVATC